MSSSGAPSDPIGYGESQPAAEFKLGDLPVELVESVFGHAGPVDRAVLAAASKKMKEIGPANILNDIWNNRRNAWQFLLRLDRDVSPRLVPCRHCLLLHPPEVCLPSFTNLPRASGNYACRTYQPAGSQNSYVTRLAPALYGLAKDIRKGAGPSFVFPEADKEDQYSLLNIEIAGTKLFTDVQTKVNVTQHGLFFRRRHIVTLANWSQHPKILSGEGLEEKYFWHACLCRQAFPRLALKATVDGTPVGSLLLSNEGQWAAWTNSHAEGNHPLSASMMGPYMLPGLFEIAASPAPRAPVVGPMVGCKRCSTDMQAEVHYPVNAMPELLITSWNYMGSTDTADNVWKGLLDITQSDTGLPRLPVEYGQIADMSGMRQ
ncbi:hypothetical protein PG989_010348 [Apiospora arundinis]